MWGEDKTSQKIGKCRFHHYLKGWCAAILTGMSTSTRRKTSFEVDAAKVAAAKEILGTKTLTDTVDAALSEVVKRRQRQQLVELLSAPGALELDVADVMAQAWR